MKCPICKAEVPEPREGEKSAYPFCSERCRLIDLGRWLGGKYQIPVEREDDDVFERDDREDYPPAK